MTPEEALEQFKRALETEEQEDVDKTVEASLNVMEDCGYEEFSDLLWRVSKETRNAGSTCYAILREIVQKLADAPQYEAYHQWALENAEYLREKRKAAIASELPALREEVWAVHEVWEESPDSGAYLVSMTQLASSHPSIVKKMKAETHSCTVTEAEWEEIDGARVDPPKNVKKVFTVYVE